MTLTVQNTTGIYCSGNLRTGGPHLHPRYTSGRLMSRVDLCTIFATAFYTPGVMEVFEALTMPEKRHQASFVTIHPLPMEFIGKTFGELFEHFMGIKVMCIGILRGIKFNQNPMPYVQCFPPASAILSKTDKVYLQGPAEWSHALSKSLERQKIAAMVLQWHWRAHLRSKVIKQRRSTLIENKLAGSPLGVSPYGYREVNETSIAETIVDDTRPGTPCDQELKQLEADYREGATTSSSTH